MSRRVWWAALGAVMMAVPGPVPCAGSLAPYEAAARAHPDSPQAQFNLGVMGLRQGDDALAARALARAVRLDPADAEGWEAYGTALLGTGRPASAARALERSTSLDPRRPGAWLELGQALASAGGTKNLAAAVRACASAARLAPSDPRPRLDGGLYLARLGRDPEAVAQLRKALGLGAGAPADTALCVLYNKDGNFPAAGKACAAAVQGGGDAETWYDLGFARERLGDDPGARTAYARAVALDPRHAPALYALAFLDFQAGDAKGALEGFEAALKARHGDYPDAEYNVAVLLGDSGRYEQAAALYRGLLRRHPDDVDARANLEAVVRAGLSGLLTRGQSDYDRGDYAGARAAWLRARRLDPGNGVAGRMLRLLAERDASAKARAAARARRTARAAVRRRLEAQDREVLGEARAAFSAGRWSAAARLLAFYTGHHPDDSRELRRLTEARGRARAEEEEYLRRGRAALASGDRSRALADARAALADVPDDARAAALESAAARGPAPAAPAPVDGAAVRRLYYAGVERYLDGDLAGAVATWNRVLAMRPDDLDARRSLARAELELKALRRLQGG